MGGVWKKLPYTWLLMLIGTLALTGFPFLSGFYSKDAIIEFAYFEQSTIGNYATYVGIITAFLTSIYSWRLFFKTFHGNFNSKNVLMKDIHESPLIMIIPLAFLSIGAVFSGFLFKETLIGHHFQDFWKNSIFILEEIKHVDIPLWFLLLTPAIVIIAIPISYYLFIKNTSILEGIKTVNQPLYNFLFNKWYFDELYDLIFVRPSKFIGIFLWKRGDQKIIDRYGPDGFSKIIKYFSSMAGKLQSGYIYDYAFIMLIGLSFLLTFLIVK